MKNPRNLAFTTSIHAVPGLLDPIFNDPLPPPWPPVRWVVRN